MKNMNIQNATTIINEIQSIIPEVWLFGGTLLGLIRDRKILPWDKDVDLGYSSDFIDDNLVNELKSKNFKIDYTYKFSHPKMKDYIFDNVGKYGKIICSKDRVKVEICCFVEGISGNRTGENTELLYYASGTPRFFVIPKQYVYPLTKIKIEDYNFNIPKLYEKNLEFIYGPSWNEPRKNWYFTADHYLCRERTIIELEKDDFSRWSKWTGRNVIEKEYGKQNFPIDINTPHQI
jgi:hypothetical protein